MVSKLLNGAFELIRNGAMQHVKPVTTFSIASIEDAFRRMQSGKHIGKLALTWSREDQVPTLVKRKSKYLVRSDATYVLAGGLGGIGRSIARLLARNWCSSYRVPFEVRCQSRCSQRSNHRVGEHGRKCVNMQY